MGRKSLADERRTRIIDALAEVIRAVGYEAATLELVAAEAGVQRTLIRHYFGNRDALISAALVHITGKYLEDFRSTMQNLSAERSLAGMVDYLFGGVFNQRFEDEAVIDALIAASGRSETVGAAVLRMYETFETTLEGALVRVFPQTDPQRVREAAYALMCLAEQHASMRGLGLGASREAGIKRAALALLDTLSVPPSSPRRVRQRGT